MLATVSGMVLYGIQPHGARHLMTPGHCKGKAHQPEHLGIAGRRVLVSRKWSNKRGPSVNLWGLGQFERARQLGEDTLTRRRRVLGDDHRDTLRSATYLVLYLLELGQCERARQLGEDTLTRSRRVLGDDHLQTLHSSYFFSVTLRECGAV